MPLIQDTEDAYSAVIQRKLEAKRLIWAMSDKEEAQAIASFLPSRGDIVRNPSSCPW